MTYTLQRTDENDDIEKTVRFDKVAITQDTLISSHTDIDGNILLQIDEDGDGKIDQNASLSVILDKIGSQEPNCRCIRPNRPGHVYKIY